MLSWLNLSWCIGDDFNDTRFPSKILGEACSSVMMEFSNFIFVQGLMDLPLVAGLFCGLIVRTPALGQELIGFLFLRNRKSSISIDLRKGCIDCAQIIYLFSLIVVVFREPKRSFEFENMWLKAGKALWIG